MSGNAHEKPLLGIDSGNNFISSRALNINAFCHFFPSPIAWIFSLSPSALAHNRVDDVDGHGRRILQALLSLRCEHPEGIEEKPVPASKSDRNGE